MTVVAPPNPNMPQQMAGLDALTAAEQERFQRRQDAAATRQDQLAGIEQGIADQDIMAQEMAHSLRRAGLADVAERFRHASQGRSFDAARRGIQGGSHDIQTRAAQEAAARDQAEQVAVQAEQARLQALTRAMQEGHGLGAMAQQMTPFEQAMMQQEAGGLEMDWQAQMADEWLRRQEEEARMRRRSGLGNVIGGSLGSMGNVLGTALAGSA